MMVASEIELFVCREYTYTSLGADSDSRIFAATEQRTIIGPVLRVHTVKCLGIYGIEIQIPSTISSKKTSWVVICRGQNRYVEESHHLEPGPIPPVRHYCERERERSQASATHSELLVFSRVETETV